MANTITAGNATNNGLAFSSDNSGTINVLTGTGAGTTAVTIDGSQNVNISTSNLNFSGTAQRITGDFSNATVANRVMFQTSTTNGTTAVSVIPNGTSTTTAVNVEAASTVGNNSFGQFLCNGSEVGINALIRGTGTYLPITFYTGGSERFRYGTAGEFGVGGANYGTSGQVLTSGGSGAAPSWAARAAPTTAEVENAMAGAAVGDVGTYAWLSYNAATVTTITAGNNSAGSGLRYWGYTGGAGIAATNTAGAGVAPSGTWKAMGTVTTSTSVLKATLYLRVA